MIYVHDLDPIALRLGPLSIHWYALAYLTGAAIAWWLGLRRARQSWRGIEPSAVEDLIFYGMVGVILGGRLGYVLVYDFAGIAADPLRIVKLWQGGMSFHGGLLGVIVAVWWWARRRGLDPWRVFDFIAPLVPIGLGLGRLGNFVNGELWGRPTDGSWGVIFPKSLPEVLAPVEIQARLAAGLLHDALRHPSQLYQATFEGLVLFAVLWGYSAKPRPVGAVGGAFLLGYGLFRFGAEFFREPDAQLGFVLLDRLSMGQVLSLPMIVFGAVLLGWAYRRDARAR